MKVYIEAASSDDNYPGICGEYEFQNIEEAINFTRTGAKVNDLILHFYPWNPEDNSSCLVMITIYDDYVE